MALREVLAQLTIEVEGAQGIASANAAINRFVGATAPAITALEQLRIKEQEATETANRLARALRTLQVTQGATTHEIDEARLAVVRARDEARGYRTEISRVGTAQRGTGAATGGAALSFGRLAAGFAVVTAGIATARRAFSAVEGSIREVIAAGDELSASATRLNISTDALQEWRFIAERANVSAETLQTAFQTVGRNAAAGRGPFRELGVSVQDSAGQLRSQEEILGDTLMALGRLPAGTRRAALAQQAFGRSGAQLLTIVEDGSEGLVEARRRFQEVGGGLDEDVIQSAEAADDAMVDLNTAFDSLKGALVRDLLPGIVVVVSNLATLVGWFANLSRQITTQTSLFETLAGAAIFLAGSLAIIALPVLIAVAAFVLMVLVVEDIVTAFRGGESVLNNFFGSIVDGVEEVLNLRAAFNDLNDGFRMIAESSAFQAVVAALAPGALVGGVGGGVAAAAAASVGGPAAATVAAAQGARGAAGTTNTSVDARSTITIQGATDPEETARAVSRALSRTYREAADVLPTAEPEAAAT